MIRHERDNQDSDKHDNCPVLLDFQARLWTFKRHGKVLVRIGRAACGECAGEHVELIFMGALFSEHNWTVTDEVHPVEHEVRMRLLGASKNQALAYIMADDGELACGLVYEDITIVC